MERSAFDQMRQVQGWHWWFVARRRILAAQLRALNLPADARILEVGCGPGGCVAVMDILRLPEYQVTLSVHD